MDQALGFIHINIHTYILYMLYILLVPTVICLLSLNIFANIFKLRELCM